MKRKWGKILKICLYPLERLNQNGKIRQNTEGFSRDVENYWTIIEEICHYLMKLVKNVEMVCFEEK